MTESVGVIGLGLLGQAFVSRLLGAGFKVVGFDIDRAKNTKLAQLGGRAAASVGDLARRCDPIVLAVFSTDQVEEVIAHSHLTTYTVSGENLGRLAGELSEIPGIDMVAPFGTSLHVSGRDRDAFEAAIKPYRSDPALIWTPSEPSLEDVFIELMARSRDNFQ